MRAAFAKSVPEVTSIDARADALPFPDSTFDLICVGQAFHWFANIASLREMGRVLAPGATLALAWNLEDADYDWVAEIRACYEAYDEGTRGDVPQYRKGVWREAFDEAIDIFPANVDRHFFDHHVLTTRDEIIDRALSKSYIASLPPSDQARVREDLAAILRRREKDALRRHRATLASC
ncbi:hypothetical protein CTAYLR_005014 [Chrysophaeum taylorii]|uniref:Methyltransferase type 11 domain-containing protein n=1 Tax=Chrysophaeum taylorii TaxID=2483200 RepID=A0AAD7UBA7_9STRA|nr:hypothetical protein CTAYLR_005014 [Chrysophaeum taylorii]